MGKSRKYGRFEFKTRTSVKRPPVATQWEMQQEMDLDLEFEEELRTELPAISKPQWIPIAQPKATENQNARDHRIERKKQTAQQVNENSTQNLNEKIIEQLRLNLVLLEDYATKHEIPKNVPIPPNVALSLSNRSIQSVPYRNYLIRKHIDSAQDFLMEIGELPQETLHPFHRKKIMDQTKAIRRLLSLLKSFH